MEPERLLIPEMVLLAASAESAAWHMEPAATTNNPACDVIHSSHSLWRDWGLRFSYLKPFA